MANYNRLELTTEDIENLRSLKAHFPYRQWFAVKPQLQAAMCVDSRRKANKLAKEYAPAAIYQV